MIVGSKNTIRLQLRTMDGLSIRFAESEERDTHALLLSPWPESLWEGAAEQYAALVTQWWEGGYAQ